MKRCSRCGEEKPLDAFRLKNPRTGVRSAWCSDCRRAYGREHYRNNKPYYLAKNRRAARRGRNSNRERLIAYLAEHPCVDCGETDIRVLQLDHRDPASKRDDVGSMLGRRGWNVIARELEKCDVRCANCHRRRTAQQFGSLRVVLASLN